MTNNINRSILGTIALTALLLQTSRARALNDIKTGEAVYVNEAKNDIRNALKKAGLKVELHFELTINSNTLRRWAHKANDLNAILINITSKHTAQEMSLIEAYITKVITSQTYYRQGYEQHTTAHDVLYMVQEKRQKGGILKRAPYYVESPAGEKWTAPWQQALNAGDYLNPRRAIYPVYKAYVIFEG